MVVCNEMDRCTYNTTNGACMHMVQRLSEESGSAGINERLAKRPDRVLQRQHHAVQMSTGLDRAVLRLPEGL